MAVSGLVKLDAAKLVPDHPLLKRLTLVTVKELMLYSLLLRVKKGHTIYKEGDSSNNTCFIILFGKFLLHGERLGPVGSVTMGDSLGEEGLLDKRTFTTTDLNGEQSNQFFVMREEMATAEEESYLLEIT